MRAQRARSARRGRFDMPVFTYIATLSLLVSSLTALGRPAPAAATPGVIQPGSVTIAGSLQSELGCPGDWQPDCALTHLHYDTEDTVWQDTWSIPAGSWEYKAALNDSWTENYGANAMPGGANIALNLAPPGR